MSRADLLLVTGVTLPLAMAVACLAPRLRARAIDWLWLAPLPSLVAALVARGRGLVVAPDPLRLTLALDDAGAMLLGGAAVLWSAAGLHAAATLRERDGTGRFAVWWLLTLTGSLGTFVVADLTSFYLAFSVASLAAFGLVTFEGTPAAARAGRVYMVLALVGEAFLLLGLVLLARGAPGGNPLITEAVAAMPAAPALMLLVTGFALKMGLVPLHVWMPLAHPVAPMPASAVLSGVIVKAGVIGLLRFLPLQAGAAGWGSALVAVGLFTAFYAVAVGITQTRAKTMLAYSTVSQMGIVAAVLGAGASRGAPDTAMLAAFYALHHMLVKGALFLGVGLAANVPDRWRKALIAAMGCLAFSLAGLPLSGGALAKYAVKPLFADDLTAMLVTLSGAGSALLMMHFLRLLWAGAPSAPAALRGLEVLAWLILTFASVAVPYALYAWVSGEAASASFSPGALWAAFWPLLLGCLLAFCLSRSGRALPSMPEGDVLMLAERLDPMIRRAGLLIEQGDAWLRRWPVATAVLVVMAIAMAVAL